MLILGSNCLPDINIFKQLKNNLRLDFEDLIDILDVIGETNGMIVPILIDALNESWKPQLWKFILPVLHNRNQSFQNDFTNWIMLREHRGFRNNLLFLTLYCKNIKEMK